MNHRLVQAIYDAGFSIMGFADSIDISRSTLRNYAYKGQGPHVRTAIRIARALGTTVEELWVERVVA